MIDLDKRFLTPAVSLLYKRVLVCISWFFCVCMCVCVQPYVYQQTEENVSTPGTSSNFKSSPDKKKSLKVRYLFYFFPLGTCGRLELQIQTRMNPRLFFLSLCPPQYLFWCS